MLTVGKLSEKFGLSRTALLYYDRIGLLTPAGRSESGYRLYDDAAIERKIARAQLKAYGADGITVQQFNESAGGQVVFHLHVHVIPRHDGVSLRAHHGEMADGDVLKANAEKLNAALA